MGSTRKATFTLSIATLSALDHAVRSGAAASKDALVERALRKELRSTNRVDRLALWEQAVQDPLFTRDIEQVEVDFEFADAEAARQIG